MTKIIKPCNTVASRENSWKRLIEKKLRVPPTTKHWKWQICLFESDYKNYGVKLDKNIMDF